MELAASTTPVLTFDQESAVRPVEVTVDPATPPVDGHDAGVKAEPICSHSTTAETTGDNNEPAVFTTANASKSSAPSATPVDVGTATEHPTAAAPTTPNPSEPTLEALIEAESAISGDSTIDELLAAAKPTAPLPTAAPGAAPSDPSTPQPSKSDKPVKKEKKPNDSFLPDETLAAIQQFLVDKVSHSQCSSHAREILEFVGLRVNDQQRRRYVGPLVQRIADQFAAEAQARGEDVSVDVQTSLCLVEQMFLTLGRESPLQDMYTQEEEEMLDLLFHGDGGSDGDTLEA